MFCPSCAAHNPAGPARCVACGGPLPAGAGAEGAAPAGRPGRRRARLRAAVAAVPLLVAVVAVLVVAGRARAERDADGRWYARGEAALAAGRPAEAAAAFARAGGYRDADRRRAAAVAPYLDAYGAAVAAADAGRFAEAIALLLPVVRALPADEGAARLLAEARAAHQTELARAAEDAEAAEDWLALERALAALAAADPGNAAVADRLAAVRRERAPIVFARDDGLYLASMAGLSGPGGPDERLVTADVPAFWPVWSPDRTRIAFVSPTPEPAASGTPAAAPGTPVVTSSGFNRYHGDLYLVDPDGRNLTLLAHDLYLRRPPVWSPDGARVAYMSSADYDWDADDGEDAGRISLRVVEVATGRETDLTGAWAGYAGGAAWSPDGTRIAFVARPAVWLATEELVPGDVFGLDLATGARTNLTGGRLPRATRLAWSPAGDSLLVVTREEGSSYGDFPAALYRLDLAGGALAPVETSSRQATLPVWSPDGSRYAYTVGGNQVRVRRPDGREIWVATPTVVSGELSWSPDGSTLLAVAQDTFDPSYLISPDAAVTAPRPLRVTYDTSWTGEAPPQWTPRTRPLPAAVPAAVAGTAHDPAPAPPTAPPVVPARSPRERP